LAVPCAARTRGRRGTPAGVGVRAWAALLLLSASQPGCEQVPPAAPAPAAGPTSSLPPVPVPILVLDFPAGRQTLGRQITFRWHVENAPAAYSFALYVDKGVDACDGGYAARFDACIGTCLGVYLSAYHFGGSFPSTAMDFGVEARDASGRSVGNTRTVRLSSPIVGGVDPGPSAPRSHPGTFARLPPGGVLLGADPTARAEPHRRVVRPTL
jgi:hypothetical protein